MTPKRIQRKRAKGWRAPKGSVYVGRGTKWGNPFVVGRDGTRIECVQLYRALAAGYLCISKKAEHVDRQKLARLALEAAPLQLRGKDLMCWCPLEDADGNRVPCHADVLLELSNSQPRAKGAA